MDTQLSKIILPLPPIPRTTSGFGRTGRTYGLQPTPRAELNFEAL
jgi:hypothetical protein